MKFAVKLALSMVAMLGVLLAVGGYFMVEQNFKATLQTAVRQNVNLQEKQKYTLQFSLFSAGTDENQTLDNRVKAAADALAAASASTQGMAVLTKGYAAVSNHLSGDIPKSQQLAAIHAGDESTIFYRANDKNYQMMAARLTVENAQYWLVSAFEITSLYAARTAQLVLFYKLYAVLMAAAALLSALVSRALTRPLQKLSGASSRIAAGAYEERIDSKRGDEIGDLSRHFDAMAAAVEEKVHSLELSVQQREDFVGAFTHELKTPMTAMLGYAALLKQNGGTPQMREKAICYIHSETKRLENLSQKLLAMLQLSEENIVFASVLLSDIFEKTQEALQVPKGICVVFPETHGETVLADSDLLVDLLYNLVQNAIHAKPKDGKVTLCHEVGQTGVTLFVADAGKGMSPQQLSRVTEAFYRVDKSRVSDENGTGLGLALCAKIAALHGTALHFESTENVGTTVSFTLKTGEGAS
ncbi:MAG: HAMP domain-containing sensor histidine kinase [Ruthenibacterium sp.]